VTFGSRRHLRSIDGRREQHMHCAIPGSKAVDLFNASGRTWPDMELRFPDEHGADQGSISASAWLAELREMRGRVFYDQGRRPSFVKTNGDFEDADEADLDAYHVIARSQGQSVGCARVAPLANIRCGLVSSAIGEERVITLLRELGTTRERACEASRWVVVPEFRGELGPRIVAASWAVARWLDMDVAFVMAGTRQKQDMALARMGARPVNAVPLLRSEVFDDELRLLYFDVLRPSEVVRLQIDEATAALDLLG
jgi:Acetyltransferase (GNAT) domain